MEQKTETEQGEDKLPHNDVDLSVGGNLKAALEKKESLGGNKRKRGQGYLKCRMIKGRPYWYRVTKVKVDGKWKNKEEYLGTRKPRG